MAVASAVALSACGSEQLDQHSACDQMSQVVDEFDQTLHRVSDHTATGKDVAPALADESGKLSSIARHSPGDLRGIGQRLSEMVARTRVDVLENRGSTTDASGIAAANTRLHDACQR
jgi:hypothetical protein